MMPVCDGLAATRRIRKLPGGADVPICAFTASSATDMHADCYALDMRVALKPLAPRQLLAIVEDMLRADRATITL
jgi:CheY-like chemotaxis protein